MNIFRVMLFFNLIFAGQLVGADLNLVPPSVLETETQSNPPAAGATPNNPANAELTLELATKKVINSISGRVLSAKTEEVDGKRVHVVKILTEDGRIQQQAVDALSGTLVDTDLK